MNLTIKIKFLVFSFIFVLCCTARAWAASQYDDDEAQPANHIERIYKQSCAPCHGEHGDGKSRAQFGLNPPPRDFTTQLARDELSRERMITSVTHGRPGTAMVGWGKRLKSDEIEGIVDYIRSTFMQPEAPSQQAEVKQSKSIATKDHPGKAIYKEHCAVCHGDNGNGATWTQTSLNPPPRNFTAAESRKQLTAERMITSVTFGRPGTAMMSFKTRLTEKQIADVVDFIRTTFMQGDGNVGGGEAAADDDYAAMPGLGNIPHGAHPGNTTIPKQPPAEVIQANMSLPLPGGLVGDPDKGREFYSANCFTCHGLKGDGKGPRSKFIQPPPRNFLAAQSRQTLNRPALFKAITIGKTGTVMPAWGKVLNDQEIANVAEYVFQNFIQASNTAGSEQHAGAAEPSTQKKKVIRN